MYNFERIQESYFLTKQYTKQVLSLLYSPTSYSIHHYRHLHLAAVKRIIRYVNGTLQRRLYYPTGTSLALYAYSDVDYARCSNTRKSTTGWCMFLDPALIS